ncbi:helix-turn-helix transcriptional regulator [Microbacterium luticocti]|uniref:helix-turn-helix transcriptional regulator n=1 Tax=Microbacterium luticocti TaxID=451764 RepID=UPI00041E5E44|nr:LuxR C-terminal-related transcriptional regulator [Microbacterium luticocti]
MTDSAEDVCREALLLGLRGAGDLALQALEEYCSRLDADDDRLVRVARIARLVGAWTGRAPRAIALVTQCVNEATTSAVRAPLQAILIDSDPGDDNDRVWSVLHELTLSGDESARAWALLSVAFPDDSLTPSLDYRHRLAEEARRIGERLGERRLVNQAANTLAALDCYAGDGESAMAELEQLWSRVDATDPLETDLLVTAAGNHALIALAWDGPAAVATILDQSAHHAVGPAKAGLVHALRALALARQGWNDKALRALGTPASYPDAYSAFSRLVRNIAASEAQRTAEVFPEEDVALLESKSLQLGVLARAHQARVRGIRSEPLPHRDLVPALERLTDSRPRFGWDDAAVALAELDADAAAAVLDAGGMWEFWPTGPRAARNAAYLRVLLGREDPFPALEQAADGFVEAGEHATAARVLAAAVRVAAGDRRARVLHRRAIELIEDRECDRTLAGLVRQRRQWGGSAPAAIPASQRHAVHTGLTDREHEIAVLAAQGLTGPEIANRLGIALGTVRNHIQHVRDKLGGVSKGELRELFAGGGAR